MGKKRFKTLEKKKVNLEDLYFQYVPGRFEQAFGNNPSADTLHVSQLPHISLLKKYMESKSADLTDSDYYRMHEAWGRNRKWIKSKISRFIKLFESISKNGLKIPITIAKEPLHKKFHNGYEIFEGHHRAAIYIVLSRRKIEAKIIKFM